MRLTLIAALDDERGIGKGGKLPWHISADLKRFKRLTTGHPIIMGRKTFESIGKPLPERTNIVITRDESLNAPGCVVAHSLKDALAAAETAPGSDEAFVIGGAEIYALALPRADRLELTLVSGTHRADAFFPEYADRFKVVSEESGREAGVSYRFVTLQPVDRPSASP